MVSFQSERMEEKEKKKKRIACIAELLLQKELITPQEKIRMLELLRKE